MKYETLKSIRTLCFASLIAAGLMSTALAQNAEPMNMRQGETQKNMADPHGMKTSMMTGMDQMQKMSMSGDIDKDFAMMMKMHHQQGVDMAEKQLAHGQSPELKTMAKKIISAQTEEITQLDHWLSKHK